VSVYDLPTDAFRVPMPALGQRPVGFTVGPNGAETVYDTPTVAAHFDGPECRLWTGACTVRLADGLDRVRVRAAVVRLSVEFQARTGLFPIAGSSAPVGVLGPHVQAVVDVLAETLADDLNLSVYHVLHPDGGADSDYLDELLLAACERRVEADLSADWAMRHDDGEAGVA
jgi:hypothetical protein